MLNGHGDDLHDYPDIRINFSSNVYTHFDHTSLFAHLTQMLPRVTSYPQPTPVSLEHALAVHLDLKPDEVMVTNGATEAIYLIAQTYAGSHSAILQPTFSEYEDACILHRHECHHCLDLVHATSFLSSSSIVWICNPNNPTGQVMDKSTLLHAIISHPSLIFVLDASYAPFTSQPVLSASETVHLPNVLMLHSMTKTYAVPGLRLGYLTASPSLLASVRRQRMPWSVNQPAQDAGLYLLAHSSDYRLDVQALMRERQRVADALSAMPYIDVMPSDTHILLCRLRRACASSLKSYLAVHHAILIRDASNFRGLDASFFRIAVQTREENDMLLRAISDYFQKVMH